MKKMLLAVAVVAFAAITLTSCDPNEPKCWEVKYKVANIEMTTYQYMTKNQLDVFIDTLKKTTGTDVRTTSVPKSQSDCISANLK